MELGTGTKSHHLKKLAFRVTLRQVFIRVSRLEIESAMWVFFDRGCELLPLWFTSTPSMCLSTVDTDSEWLGGGGGVESCWSLYSTGV